MSRITGVTLLLVILVVSFYHSTASHAEREFQRFKGPKGPILQCRCTGSRGKMNCPKPMFPTNSSQIRALDKCLCSEPDQHKFKTACEQYRRVRQLRRTLIPSRPL